MKTPFFLLICFILLSCSVSESEKSLETAANIIEFRPDSALSIIRKTDASELASRRLKAKHAVLHAMALDKCYIDITSDSIIAPALEYYKRHGSAEYKLKANYYRGVIARNSGDWDTAMTYYVMAERFADKCKDKKAVARLHNAKMYIYINLYQNEAAAIEGRKSADLYLSQNDSNRYINTMLDIALLYRGIEDSIMVKGIVEELTPFEESFSIKQSSIYHLMLLQLTERTDPLSLKRQLDTYIANVTDNNLKNWVYIAYCYMRCGYLEDARSAIERAFEQPKKEYYPVIYKVAANIYAKSRDYKISSYAYEKYVDISDQTDINIFRSDAKHIEYKYASENNILRKRLTIAVLSFSTILVLLLCTAIIYVISKRYRSLREEKAHFEDMYNSLLNEQKILKRTRKETKLDEDVLQLVEERMEVLNKFAVAHITNNFSKEAYIKLESLLEDREYFLESTRMSFAIYHHRFLKYLTKQGLNNWEIGFCCLYCIGLNGSEIGGYLNSKTHYKMNGKIRDKLKLDRSTSLKTFLLKKLEESDR